MTSKPYEQATSTEKKSTNYIPSTSFDSGCVLSMNLDELPELEIPLPTATSGPQTVDATELGQIQWLGWKIYTGKCVFSPKPKGVRVKCPFNQFWYVYKYYCNRLYHVHSCPIYIYTIQYDISQIVSYALHCTPFHYIALSIILHHIGLDYIRSYWIT